MKLEFLNRPASEQTLFLQETAARRGLLPVMVEKDFWVSWTLAALFAHPEFGGQLVFKGGTSLSKVFGVIDRFSEDIDLSVSPAFLGISEEWVEGAGSRKRTEARMSELESACIGRVRDRFVPELERTFWEKATILHAEHHRDPAQPLRDRFSRHYSDMASLARHPVKDRALARDDLRRRVANWKSRFFAASWARYDLATPGSFHLVPPGFRLAELEKDYHAMQDMFLSPPPPFQSLMETVSALERQLNASCEKA